MRHGRGRHLHRVRIAGARRAHGERRTGRRCWRHLFGSEFFLVGHGRYCGHLGRLGIVIHEHGWSNRRSLDGYAHALDRRALRLDCLFRSGSRSVPARCCELAPCQSSPHSGTGPQPISPSRRQLRNRTDARGSIDSEQVDHITSLTFTWRRSEPRPL